MSDNKMKCSCEEYLKSMPQIDGAQVLANVHGISYTGSSIKFCPWCGDKLLKLSGVKPKLIPRNKNRAEAEMLRSKILSYVDVAEFKKDDSCYKESIIEWVNSLTQLVEIQP